MNLNKVFAEVGKQGLTQGYWVDRRQSRKMQTSLRTFTLQDTVFMTAIAWPTTDGQVVSESQRCLFLHWHAVNACAVCTLGKVPLFHK